MNQNDPPNSPQHWWKYCFVEGWDGLRLTWGLIEKIRKFAHSVLQITFHLCRRADSACVEIQYHTTPFGHYTGKIWKEESWVINRIWKTHRWLFVHQILLFCNSKFHVVQTSATTDRRIRQVTKPFPGGFSGDIARLPEDHSLQAVARTQPWPKMCPEKIKSGKAIWWLGVSCLGLMLETQSHAPWDPSSSRCSTLLASSSESSSRL